VPELRLTRIAPGLERSPVPDLPADARIWRDWEGVPRAYGYTAGGQHWMCLPGLGAFRFASTEEPVEAIVPDSTPRELVEAAYRRSVMPFVLQARGRELLHASAVLMPSGAAAFCGSSGAGKSTLAHSLGQRGYRPLADDALMFETANASIQVHPMPFELRLSKQSALTGRERVAKEVFLASDGEPVADNGDSLPIPLAAAFVVERVEKGPNLEIRSFSPTDAFSLLLYHAHCFSDRDEERRRLMLERYLELVARVPVFRIRYRPGLARLPALLDEIERAVR
jgi:hypothetical protein